VINGRNSLLIFVSWLATLLTLPLIFFALVSASLSPSSPHASAKEILMLATGPLVAITALVSVMARGGSLKPSGILGLVVPLLLAVGELAFAFIVWKAG
jgi:hypothetical protein